MDVVQVVMRQLSVQSFLVCKIMCMCTRASTGISVLKLSHFPAWKVNACPHMGRIVRTFSTPLYKVLMKMNTKIEIKIFSPARSVSWVFILEF